MTVCLFLTKNSDQKNDNTKSLYWTLTVCLSRARKRGPKLLVWYKNVLELLYWAIKLSFHVKDLFNEKLITPLQRGKVKQRMDLIVYSLSNHSGDRRIQPIEYLHHFIHCNALQYTIKIVFAFNFVFNFVWYIKREWIQELLCIFLCLI